jgi:hypothetical protein
MFIDISNSIEQSKAFKRYRIDKKYDMDIDMQIMILTNGSWPFITNDHSNGFNIDILNDLQNQFHQYYQTCHNGRKLTFIKQLSKYYIVLKGFDKPYELWVSWHQLGILSFKVKMIKDLLNILGCQWKELSKYLIPLIGIGLVKCRNVDSTILSIKDISKQSFDQDWCIDINLEFQSSTTRIKLNTNNEIYYYTGISSNIDNEDISNNDKDSSIDDLDENRKSYVQAMIVRLLKEKKELCIQELIQSIHSQGNSLFIPSLDLIKKCIDGLVEKGYIDRDTECEKYIYIA